MFYVYHGYISADNCDASEGPIFKITELHSEQAVLAFKQDFDEDLHEECSNIIFRVFKGNELELVPESKVIKYSLQSKPHQPPRRP